ncbi:MAG: hypothetical protein KF777_18510, partial [Planctomycetaceae bacterium]|nr:hypothetical protein [Planctomycetaceae bacterium]
MSNRAFAALAFLCLVPALPASSADLKLNLRKAVKVAPEVDGWNQVTTPATWDAKKTAIVVCDMWDTHTCPNSARRVAE